MPYIIVQETVGHMSAAGERIIYVSGMWPGPWHFDANIPGRNLSVHLSGDIGMSVVRAVGRRILHLATYPLDDVPAYPGNRYDTPSAPPLITQKQAFALARHSLGPMAAEATTVFAHNVLFTNATYDRLPAWVVTFEGVTQANHGLGPVRFHHEMNVVVDARTGAYKAAFS